ncbi:5-formyltetrahydrofolate cyclo-ligase [Candidatus Peregrinibacteria bacterium]|nr:5-formyltetrahydrofolate cyclo-ligase [Candidatus Peregrinibacteria bacterium]
MVSMETAEKKQRIRNAILERLQHLPPQTLALESRLICKRLTELLPKKPLVLAAFFPLKTEPDIRPFLRSLLKNGAELYLPSSSSLPFLFRHTLSLQHLTVGPWNIPEPSETSPPLDPKRLTHALLPGRAFDREGWRIGRGGAGYDLWIRQQHRENPETIFFGIAFECQILQHVPHVEHDERMDGIVTARGLQPITYNL